MKKENGKKLCIYVLFSYNKAESFPKRKLSAFFEDQNARICFAIIITIGIESTARRDEVPTVREE